MCKTEPNTSGNKDEFLSTVRPKALTGACAYYNAHARVHAKSHNLEEMKENAGRLCIASGGDRGTGVILSRVIHLETDWPMVKGQT